MKDRYHQILLSSITEFKTEFFVYFFEYTLEKLYFFLFGLSNKQRFYINFRAGVGGGGGTRQGAITFILSLTTSYFLFVPVKEAKQTKLSSMLGSESLLKRDAFCIFDNYSFQVQSGFVKIVDLLFEPLSAVMSLVLIWQYVGVATMGAVGVILLYVPANILLARKYASFQVIHFI